MNAALAYLSGPAMLYIEGYQSLFMFHLGMANATGFLLQYKELHSREGDR